MNAWAPNRSIILARSSVESGAAFEHLVAPPLHLLCIGWSHAYRRLVHGSLVALDLRAEQAIHNGSILVDFDDGTGRREKVMVLVLSLDH